MCVPWCSEEQANAKQRGDLRSAHWLFGARRNSTERKARNGFFLAKINQD